MTHPLPSLSAALEAIEHFSKFTDPDIRATARRLAASELGISHASLALLERLWRGGEA